MQRPAVLLGLAGVAALGLLYAERRKRRAAAVRRDLERAVVAVTHAAEIGMAVRATFVQGTEVLKGDKSPVTVADYAIQAMITLYLQEVSGDGQPFRMVAEEDSATLTADPELLAVVTRLVNAHCPLAGHGSPLGRRLVRRQRSYRPLGDTKRVTARGSA